jgi:hypothetical protein
MTKLQLTSAVGRGEWAGSRAVAELSPRELSGIQIGSGSFEKEREKFFFRLEANHDSLVFQPEA